MNKINLKPIGRGKYSDIFAIFSGNDLFAMKVSYYTEETIEKYVDKKLLGDIEGAKEEKEKDSIVISEKFSKITKILKEKNITPHFVNIFEERDVKNFAKKIPGLEKRMSTLTKNQQKYNHVAFMELFDSDLTEHFSKKIFEEHEIKIIIFQILYTIAAAQHILSGFRHNDLSTNNILVRKEHLQTNKYTVDGIDFFTPTKYHVAITDYDFVHVPGIKIFNNRKVVSRTYKVTEESNISYDSHLFLKSILKCYTQAFGHNTATYSFLRSLETFADDRHPREISSLNPRLLLKHIYFESLKINPPEIIAGSYKI